MKRLLLVSLVLAMAAAPVFGQGGNIGLWADPAGFNCILLDQTPGLSAYYVVHNYTVGATASQFSAPQPACLFATYLSDTAVFPVTIGNSQSGVAIGYGTCLVAPIHVLTINYFTQGLTAECCYYPTLPDPSVLSGQIEVVDCGSNLLFASGYWAVVNPNPTCDPCEPATEPSTWGKVKAMFE